MLLWVGDDRTEEAVRPFFTQEMGRRRCHTLPVVCLDMWAAYAKLVREHARNAQILFDRFHIVKHLHAAVEEVRRSEMRRLSRKQRVVFKRSRWRRLKNPWTGQLMSASAWGWRCRALCKPRRIRPSRPEGLPRLRLGFRPWPGFPPLGGPRRGWHG